MHRPESPPPVATPIPSVGSCGQDRRSNGLQVRCPIPPPAGVLSAHRHFEDSEGTIAYSDRPGFQVARWLSPLVRPGIRHTARKLWVDDLAYAERRYELRQRGEFPG